MPRVDIKQDEDNVDNHEQRERESREWRSMANENDNAVMSRNIRNPSEMQPRASDSMHVTPVWQRPQQPVSCLADAASLPCRQSRLLGGCHWSGVEWSLAATTVIRVDLEAVQLPQEQLQQLQQVQLQQLNP